MENSLLENDIIYVIFIINKINAKCEQPAEYLP